MPHRTAVALAGLCILAAGCSANSNRAAPAATTSTTVPPVAPAALNGLLLSAAQISAALGTTDVSVATDRTSMEDVSALVSRRECLPIYTPAEANAYANSGSSGVHRQFLGDPSNSHEAEQSVVLFPTAQQASAFFAASAQRWQRCSNEGFVHTMSGGREVWDVGPISNANGVLSTSARISLEVYNRPGASEGGARTGQRALTVRNNVAIDILTHSAAANDPAAVNIATQIAAEVPSK